MDILRILCVPISDGLATFRVIGRNQKNEVIFGQVAGCSIDDVDESIRTLVGIMDTTQQSLRKPEKPSKKKA